MSSTNNWENIEPHIERHESGCWSWDGTPVEGKVFRVVAEAYGAPLPNAQVNLYRMPDCTLGMRCVNPNHIGTRADYIDTVDGRRQDWPEPPKKGTGLKLTPRDKRFLKTLNIGWE
jgi:hypothetical protein